MVEDLLIHPRPQKKEVRQGGLAGQFLKDREAL
jgi:hypothetical protein